MADKTFRADLYFWINVVSIMLPPPRERREGIPLLASFYFQHFSNKYNAGVKGTSRRAQSALIHYQWPGNVRELQNTMKELIVNALKAGSGSYTKAAAILGRIQVIRTDWSITSGCVLTSERKHRKCIAAALLEMVHQDDVAFYLASGEK